MANATKITAPKTVYFIGETITATMGAVDPGVGGHSWGWGRSNSQGMGSGDTGIAPTGTTFNLNTSSWVIPPGEDRLSVTITLTSWATDPNPDGVQGTGDDNYTAGNKVGDALLAFTLFPASTPNPTISSLGLAEANPVVTSAAIGGYVQGVSALNWDITAAGGANAAIVDWEITVDGRVYRTKTGTTAPIASSGTIPVTVKVTDSRGLTTTTSEDITVLAYSPPKITSFQAFRVTGAVADDNGVSMKLSFDGVASSLIVGTEKNATSFVIKTRPRGTETWTQRAAGNDVLNVSYWVSASGFPVDTAYEARVELSDKLGTVAAVTFVSKAGILLDWGNGTMGVGKEWVQGTLDVEGDTYTSGKFDGASAVIAGSITHRAGATVEPAGMVSMFAGSTAPTGWLLCQGQAVSRTTYAALFAAIGTTYGVGNGSSTFNLPDLRGRVPIGSGTGTAGSATAHPLGQNGGQETHTHTEGDMSAAIGASNGNTNQMSYQAVDRNGRGPATSGAYTMFGNGANSTAYGWNHYTKVYGTTAAGDSMQPFLTLNFIIKT